MWFLIVLTVSDSGGMSVAYDNMQACTRRAEQIVSRPLQPLSEVYCMPADGKPQAIRFMKNGQRLRLE